MVSPHSAFPEGHAELTLLPLASLLLQLLVCPVHSEKSMDE